MDTGIFIRGLALGFTIAATVGPITMLTIRRTLASGWAVGFASGLGVATADATYAAVAAFGITAVSDVLVSVARPLALVGGAFLVYLGIRTMRSVPVDPRAADPTARRPGLLGAYLSILGLTLTNPLTILSFAAFFVAFGVRGSTLDAAVLVTGVGAGSVLWWIVLTATLSAIRGRLTLRALRWANVISGFVVTVFGVLAIASGVRG
jgi:threonine/homoserine/homoserine lactone efflux protein